jgi:hypothetical protein
MTIFEGFLVFKTVIGRHARAGDLDACVHSSFLKALHTGGSRQPLIVRIALPEFLPYQAWHGYGVTNAHHWEVEVWAGQPASIPPLSGRRRCDAGGGRHKQMHYGANLVQFVITANVLKITKEAMVEVVCEFMKKKN